MCPPFFFCYRFVNEQNIKMSFQIVFDSIFSNSRQIKLKKGKQKAKAYDMTPSFMLTTSNIMNTHILTHRETIMKLRSTNTHATLKYPKKYSMNISPPKKEISEI
ncbi:hypothetical protein ACFFRR_001978 [Megaselia abdita]